MNYTIEGLQDLMASILQRTGNNPDEKVKPAELKLIFDYFLGLQQAMIAAGLATAAATAGSEQKSIPGGVNTVALENLPLSTGAGAVVMGYPLQIGSTLLLPAQTNKIENGVYEVTAEGLKRLEGYDTASGLSRVNVAVQNGDRAGDIYQQPNTLTSDNAEKTFNYISNQSEALKSLASLLKEVRNTDWIDFDGTEDEDTGEFTPKLEYVIGDKIEGFEVKEVSIVQPSFDKELQPVEQWSYDALIGKLTLNAQAVSNMRKAEGHKIKLKLVAQTKIPATQETAPSPTGLDTGVFQINNASNGYAINHLKDTQNVTVEAYGVDGKPDRNIYAIPVTNSQFKLYIPKKFTGKIYANFYPKTA